VRYQFRLVHLFVLVAIIALAMALVAQWHYHKRLEARQTAELLRAHRVLRENHLDWQLGDLPQSHVRIIVEDFYGDGDQGVAFGFRLPKNYASRHWWSESFSRSARREAQDALTRSPRCAR
jgi:hypothetical protein